ncbi:hypothetical protein CHS0354_015299 [Potamilus streckersoni]|nr:hypothetical protein CHS0354_015299 [Potamilus streckersoni]
MEGPVKLTMTFICGSIKIQSVSCGKEHVLLLSSTGEVYSYGKGSRGQLGYGDLHVDQQTTPLPVETLSGLAVRVIAAGGWHSTAVTAEGDLYVWGWNESGQLGLTNGKKELKEFDSTLAQTNTKVTSAPEKTISSDELQPENIENLRRNSDTSFQRKWDIKKSRQSVNSTFLQFDRSGNTMTWNTRQSCNEGEDVSAQIFKDEQMFIKTCNACQSKNVEKSQPEVKTCLKAWNKRCFVDSDQHCGDVLGKTDFVTALINSNLEKPAIQLTDKPGISNAGNSSCSRNSTNQDLSDISYSMDIRNQNLSDIRNKCSGENEKLYQNTGSFTDAWHNNRSVNAAHNNSEAKKQKFSNCWNTHSVGAGDTDLNINERPSFAGNIKGHISAVHGEQRSNIKLHKQRMHLVFHQNTEPVQIQGVPQVLDLPEAVKVTKVSCGSRHTAVLLDNGCLMTTGWNGYGQLCHSDVTSRDFFQTVSFFTDQQLVVTNVFCDMWTTAIIAQEITEH